MPVRFPCQRAQNLACILQRNSYNEDNLGHPNAALFRFSLPVISYKANIFNWIGTVLCWSLLL